MPRNSMQSTNEFIGCASLDLDVTFLSNFLNRSVTNTQAQAVLVTIDGRLVASAPYNLQTTLPPTSRSWNTTIENFLDTTSFQKLTSRIDWRSAWDSKTVQQILLNTEVDIRNGRELVAYPIPVPPEEYDPKYRPEFWIIFSAADMHTAVVAGAGESVESDVHKLTLKIISIGIAGMAILLFIVWVVSKVLTRPLNYMEKAAWRIVNHSAESATAQFGKLAAAGRDPLMRCTPKTEITELVSEFQEMIQGFSGTGSSSVARSRLQEVRNYLTWQEEFGQLYDLDPDTPERLSAQFEKKLQSRRLSMTKIVIHQDSEGGAVFRSPEILPSENEMPHVGRADSSTLFESPETRKNLGSNLHDHRYGARGKLNGRLEATVRISRSALFRWLVGLIMLPTIATNCIIAIVVSSYILRQYPLWVDGTKSTSLKEATDSLQNTAALRTTFTEQVMTRPLRDLHFLTRLAGWLLFDAVNRSDAFTSLETKSVEECKDYPPDGHSCPFFSTKSLSPCDCKWHDPWNRTCQSWKFDTRNLQRLFFACQARDIYRNTGDRSNSSSFPDFDYSPETTLWFTNLSEVPGSSEGANATGYQTTYDRVRVASALSAVSMPIYNYVNEDRHLTEHSSMASYIYYDLDGMVIGYAGCNYDAAEYAHFESSVDNDAYLVNPALCPRGKFGYDPRCRPWYISIRDNALMGDPVYVTAPYTSSAISGVGVSAGSALMDPADGEFVAETLVEYSPEPALKALERTSAYFYFIISPTANKNDDTVVGPDHPVGAKSAAIADVILPFDEKNSTKINSYGRDKYS